MLDPSMGSGTTGVASKIFGANFIGIDIHKEFVDIARSRIQEHMKDVK